MMRKALIGTTAFALMVLSACGSSDEQAAPAASDAVATNQVEAVKSYRFSPADITVAAGTTVTWTNSDNFVHDVHLVGADDIKEDLPVDGSASITFEDPGLIRYQCSLHPSQMNGSVLVT